MEPQKTQTTEAPSDSDILTPPTLGEPKRLDEMDDNEIKELCKKDSSEIVKHLTHQEKLLILLVLKEIDVRAFKRWAAGAGTKESS